MPNQPYKLIQSYHLWFEIFDKPYEQGFNAGITCNYDYETRDGKKWVYVDIGIKLNHASIEYRSGFAFTKKALTWNDIFVLDTVNSLLKTAFEETQKGYQVYCEANNLPMPAGLIIPESLLIPFANTIIEQYTLYRSISDEQYAHLINIMVMEAKPGYETGLIFKYTFHILDEVLFYHPGFNKERNRDIFSGIIPLQRYATIKHNCKAIENRKISLSGYDMVMFFQCLNCALQVLVGSKAELIIAFLEKIGLNAELQAAYIKGSTNQFKQVKKMLKDSNVRIENFENHVDWMSLMQ